MTETISTNPPLEFTDVAEVVKTTVVLLHNTTYRLEVEKRLNGDQEELFSIAYYRQKRVAEDSGYPLAGDLIWVKDVSFPWVQASDADTALQEGLAFLASTSG